MWGIILMKNLIVLVGMLSFSGVIQNLKGDAIF